MLSSVERVRAALERHTAHAARMPTTATTTRRLVHSQRDDRPEATGERTTRVDELLALSWNESVTRTDTV